MHLRRRPLFSPEVVGTPLKLNANQETVIHGGFDDEVKCFKVYP